MPSERDAPGVADLVRQARTDHAAFAGLVRLHQDGVHRVCRRLLGSPDLAADAAQEAFLKLHAHLEDYDPTRPLRPWVYRIAINTALTMQRSSSRHTAALAGFARQRRDRRVEGPTDRQIELLALVAELPERERAMLQLRYAEGFGVGEIAEMFDTTPNAVSVAVYRAKKRVLRAAEETRDAV